MKLFISHGGLGSIMESKYYGVPVLGMPVFGDQPGNVKMAVKEGWAVEADFVSLTEQSLNRALGEVLTNSRYNKKFQLFSCTIKCYFLAVTHKLSSDCRMSTEIVPWGQWRRPSIGSST